MTDFDKEYKRLLREIMDNGIEELSERTGHKTKSLAGLTMVLDLSRGFPLLTLRKIPLKLFVAEQAWYLSGSRRPDDFLSDFTRIWDDFSELDGVVTAAYGYRWRHFFGRDQIKDLIKLLQKEPSSRQGVVVTWDPASDGLNPNRKKKNVPCPYSFVVNIIGNKLNLHNVVRSNDMLLGFPHDVGGLCLVATLTRCKARGGCRKIYSFYF